jgi:hypothetical protein
MGITVGFGVLGLIFLITPLAAAALSWWVMAIGFGAGQLGIGYLIWRERSA